MKNKKHYITLKTRIMISTLFPVVIAFVLISAVVFTSLFNSLHETVKAEFLQISQKYASDFENRINVATDYLSLVSSTYELRVATGYTDRESARDTTFHAFNSFGLLDGSSVYFEPDMYDGLDDKYIGTEYGTKKTGRICWYFYKDGGKTLYLPEALQDEIEYELPHYTKAKETNKPIYTEPTTYEVEGRNIPMFTITYPINDTEGAFIGATTVDLFLEDLYDQLQNERIYSTGYIVISNDIGQIVYSPLYDDIGENRDDIFPGIVYPARNESVAYSNATSVINGKDCFIATGSVYIQQLDSTFYVSVAAPLDEINAVGTQLIILLISLSMMIIGVIALLLYYLIGKISTPIRNITENANKIANGDVDMADAFNNTESESNSYDEVHILHMAIKKMLMQINETHSLKRDKDIAEAQAQAQGDFLAKMSHEIRTPMNAVVGMTELILREEIPQSVYENALAIKNAGNNLLSIINDILDFSKIKSGKMEIIPTEYIFASLINDVINIIRVKTIESPISFVVNLNSAIPGKLIGDEVRIRQILINLLNNAVKYTHEGFITMTVDGEIAEDNTFVLIIEMSDSGIGIKPEDIDKLFGNFVQVDTTLNKGVQGTGLGLAITKSLITSMGGDISVYSQYGTGSTFTVTLPQHFTSYEPFASVSNPSDKKVLIYEIRGMYADSISCSIDNLGVECILVQDDDAFSEALKTGEYPFVFVSSLLIQNVKNIIRQLGVNPKVVLLAEYGAEFSADKNMKTIAMPAHSISIANILNDVTNNAGYGGSEDAIITFSAPSARLLIIDDIPTNLKVAEGLMAPYHMQIDTCTSGEAALEMVSQTDYDIIFMDHMMPGMDGIEATRRIREMDGAYYANVPIIALTANAISGVQEMFISKGMNDFLSKPIEMSKLNSILEQWIPREKKGKFIDKEPESKATVTSFEVEGLDVKAGIKSTGGSMSLYITTLSLFYEDGTAKVTQIDDCLQQKDTRLYATYTHALKSTLYIIGAHDLSEVAKELEAAGNRSDMDFIHKNNADFIDRLVILLEHIKTTLATLQQNSNPDGTVDKSLLVILKKALNEMDAATIDDTISKLQSQKMDSQFNAAIDDIYQKVLLFEYDEAEQVIDDLLG